MSMAWGWARRYTSPEGYVVGRRGRAAQQTRRTGKRLVTTLAEPFERTLRDDRIDVTLIFLLDVTSP